MVAAGKEPASAQTLEDLGVETIKQYAGPLTASRRVKVSVPGKFLPQLQPAERAVNYEGEAVEFKQKHNFARHLQGWGGAHTGPGIRFLCVSDAIDDPDNIADPEPAGSGGAGPSGA